MIPDTVGPLSRPFLVARLPETGKHVMVEASAEERGALAADLGLCALPELVARLLVKPTRAGAQVSGLVRARVLQTCVVSLDEFESVIDEEVTFEFVEIDERAAAREPRVVEEDDADPPDEIVDGRIDLAAIVAETLALALDPYPRKPGAVFESPADENPQSPFARLAGLTKPD